MAVFPHNLPFNLPVEEGRVYLKHLGIERDRLMSAFFPGSSEDAFSDFIINMERLGINLQEAKILSGETTGDGTVNSGLWNFYGFDKSTGYKPFTDPADSGKQIKGGSWDSVVTGRVDVFMQQTELKYKEMLSMLLCYSINPVTGFDSGGNEIRTINIVSIDGNNSSCETDNLQLTGVVTPDHLQRIHRFLRLWRKLGWEMRDLDKAALAFHLDFGNDINLNKEILCKISQADFLSKYFDLPVDRLLAFWSNISTGAYIDYLTDGNPRVASLYELLFSNKSVLNPIDPAFKNPASLSGLLDDHSATIVSALQISNDDYQRLKGVMTDLTLPNLSTLFRNALLARNLKLKSKDFLSLKKVIGVSIDPFESPASTFKFLQKADTVNISGFSTDQLNYIFSHDFLESTTVAPSDDDISLFLSQVRSSLRASQNSTADEQRNTIVQKFSEKLKISASSTGMLLQKYVAGITNPAKKVVEDFRADDFSTLAFLKTYTDGAGKDFEPKFVRSNPAADVTLAAVPDLFNDYMRVEKVASVINKLKLSNSDLEFILVNWNTMKVSNLAVLPVSPVTGDFTSFENLVNLIRARDTMPVGSPDFFTILSNAVSGSDKYKWITDLVTRTNWDKAAVIDIVGPVAQNLNAGILNTSFPDDFRNGNLILQIKRCLSLIDNVGLSTSLIKEAIKADFDSTISNALKNAAKSKYSSDQWLTLAKSLRDDLREKQREALVAYVVAHAEFNPASSKFERWKNSDELYGFLLIDVEMQPITMTSRIKQAICSVQLFIDRVLMNLEHPGSNPTVSPLQLDGNQAEEWKEWRKLFRVWEANRKIFLYPENWIEPELRDDKSPFFKDLETILKQNELTNDNVEDAFHIYLDKLDEVARLEVVGLYHQVETNIPNEEDIDILHVFARTYTNPHKYFHRTLEDGEWTSWTKLDIDVDGDHIVPVIFNRKLCLFWLFFTREAEETNSINPKASSISSPLSHWKIQVAWSEFRKNKWTAKRLSKSFIHSDEVSTTADLEGLRISNCYINTAVDSEHLYIAVGGSVHGNNQAFIF
ncbi:MAG: neuraminidase-like domain-containing protein, partial [Bacteroidota bacterium]